MEALAPQRHERRLRAPPRRRRDWRCLSCFRVRQGNRMAYRGDLGGRPQQDDFDYPPSSATLEVEVLTESRQLKPERERTMLKNGSYPKQMESVIRVAIRDRIRSAKSSTFPWDAENLQLQADSMREFLNSNESSISQLADSRSAIELVNAWNPPNNEEWVRAKAIILANLSYLTN